MEIERLALYRIVKKKRRLVKIVMRLLSAAEIGA